jgi:spermidine synthase
VARLAESVRAGQRVHLLALYVFLLSGVGFAFQVVLTRLFSVLFQHHFVFLIVSIAIAGLSIGAAVATFSSRKDSGSNMWSQLTLAGGVLALLLAATAGVLALLPSQIVLVALLALLPYVSIGYMNAVIFARFARYSGVLYAADLLGGAVGLAAALALVGYVGAYSGVLLLAFVAALLALIPAGIGGRVLLQRGLLLAVLLAIAFPVNAVTGFLDFIPSNLNDPAPDKTMLFVLQMPNTTLVETRWDPFARVDMVAADNDSLRYVFTDAGAGSLMIPYDGNDEGIAWLKDDIEYLPFTLDSDSTRRVLILGAGAGRDVLMARLAGAEVITAVEINPTLVDMTRDAASYNGSVFDLPGVETIISDGRNYVERSEAVYDLIYANVVYTQAAPPGSAALAENYIFTREALTLYWNRLSENGRIGFVTHHGIEGLRLLVAALDMLRAQGKTVQEALMHVSLMSVNTGDPETRTSVVMIKRQPWTAEEANAFTRATHARGAGALYLPHYMEIGMEPLLQGAVTLEEYIAVNRDFNFIPTTDDKPFFYQFRPGLPQALADLLLASVVLVFAYLSWLIFFFVRRDNQQWKRASLAPYFAILGAAFMLIEAPMIQRFSLLLGQPVLALIAAVGTLLIGGGLGSFFSRRFPLEVLPQRIAVFAGGVTVVVLLSLLVYPMLIQWALPFDLPLRVLVTVLALLPLGFLMGVPFPSGLRVADQADSQAIAAFWGANAVSSVLGAALAMALAMSVGFSAALALGAGLYALIAVLAYISWPRVLKLG